MFCFLQSTLVIYNLLRKLAKSNKYQLLYTQYKESGMSIFTNISDYTEMQVIFMSWLSFYSGLYTDVYMNEVDEIVLTDEIYEDAYSYYKNKTKNKKNTQQSGTVKSTNKRKNKKPTSSTTHVVFRKPVIKSRST